MLAVIVDGTRAVIRNVVAQRHDPGLFTSSGAVYGKQPPELPRVPRTTRAAPDCLEPRSAYHEGKRTAELALAIAQSQGAAWRASRACSRFWVRDFRSDAHYRRRELRAGPLARRPDSRPGRRLAPIVRICIRRHGAWLFAIFATRRRFAARITSAPRTRFAIGDLAGARRAPGGRRDRGDGRAAARRPAPAGPATFRIARASRASCRCGSRFL